VHTVPGR